MNMEQLSKALEGVSVDNIDKKLSKRSEKINEGKAEIPRYEYDTNITVKTLHPDSQFVKITEVIDQEGAKTFRFEPDESKGTKRMAPFIAGQYVSISLKIGESILTRPYAISSAPADALPGNDSKYKNGFYTITVKKVNDAFASDYILENWKTGTQLEISAPEGFFYYEPLRDAKEIVGLAGGSGITPLYSMAQALRDGTEDFNLTLLYGCRSEKEILFKKELDDIAKSCDRFKVIYVLSDEEKDGYEHGFLGVDLIRKYAPASDYSLYVCGPAAMYEFVRGEVKKLGLPKRRVRYEAPGEYKVKNDPKFSKDALEKTYKIKVDLPDGRKIIDARADESILVALERAGIKAPSHCRSGECGFCRMRVKSGEYYAPESTEHRRGADIKNGYIHACTAFPLSDLHILLDYDRGEVVRKVKDMKNN